MAEEYRLGRLDKPDLRRLLGFETSYEFEKVVLPTTVQSELASSKAPPFVRHWVANLPAWLEVRDAPFSQGELDWLFPDRR